MPQSDAMCPMCEWMMGWGWGVMLLFALFWIAVIALVGWLIYRFMKGRGGTSGAPANPEATLEDRYARGEIDRETYLRMQADLESRGE